MLNSIKLSIFAFLIPLTLNIVSETLLYKDVTINGGETKPVTLIISRGLRIFTKIDKSSKIMVDITSEKPFNTSLVYYDRTKNEGDSTDKVNTPIISSSGNTFTCVYSVKKDDVYNYGVLIIADGSLYNEVVVKVTVVTDTAFWVYIVIGLVVLIVLIVGVFVVCRKFYRCMCCRT